MQDSDGRLRYLNAEERELLMGMGYEATKFCMSASSIKQNPQAYVDKRLSLLGDGFAMASFAWVCAQLCRKWQVPLTPAQLVAPGTSLHAAASVPMAPRLTYVQDVVPHQCHQLVQQVSRHVSHTGSDVSIALGTPFSPKVGSHPSLRAGWWDWRLLFKSRWGFSSHINSLEMRVILQAVKWRARNPDNFQQRWLHLADSMVCNYILAKGRTSSRMLQPLVRQIGAYQLAMDGRQLCGHVDSSDNPTDDPSRA